MNGKANIEAVLWDMDGLLLDTERLSREAWRSAASDKGFPFPDEIFASLIGHNHPTCLKILVEHYGPEFPHGEIAELRKKHRQKMIDASGIALKKGAKELLEYLAENSIPCALATSTHTLIAEENLRFVNLMDFFAVRVGGECVERGKPEPDIFLKAAERMAKDPARCLVLEDSCPGVLAATRAGMKVIMIPDLVQPKEEILPLIYKIFPSLLDVLDFLKSSPEIYFHSKRSEYEMA